ncbi:unnamed protein product [Danaus chrysippus]|uniref:(African queen) hypothetical protein n=1 Tax=Danaus chrysippus TaxID=151541 RepID=A0A8J2VV35_9NEOP|nr:unnamed protein product [Danaus chrysippus]
MYGPFVKGCLNTELTARREMWISMRKLVNGNGKPCFRRGADYCDEEGAHHEWVRDGGGGGDALVVLRWRDNDELTPLRKRPLRRESDGSPTGGSAKSSLVKRGEAKMATVTGLGMRKRR